MTNSASSEHRDVYLDITIDEIPAGIIEIKLRDDIVPKTCRSFRALCLGEKGKGFRTICCQERLKM